MNRGDAVGRARERSSLLWHPNANFFEKNEGELRKREKLRLAGPPRLSALRVDERT
jgi:hypothetical protein